MSSVCHRRRGEKDSSRIFDLNRTAEEDDEEEKEEGDDDDDDDDDDDEEEEREATRIFITSKSKSGLKKSRSLPGIF